MGLQIFFFQLCEIGVDRITQVLSCVVKRNTRHGDTCGVKPSAAAQTLKDQLHVDAAVGAT